MVSLTGRRISPAVMVGPYIDHRKGKGAVIAVSNTIAELDEAQVRTLITALSECIKTPPIQILPPTVIKEGQACGKP